MQYFVQLLSLWRGPLTLAMARKLEDGKVPRADATAINHRTPDAASCDLQCGKGIKLVCHIVQVASKRLRTDLQLGCILLRPNSETERQDD